MDRDASPRCDSDCDISIESLQQPCQVDGLCLNGGTCTARAGSDFRCECVQDWSGARCTLQPPLPGPNTDAFLQAQPEISAHAWVKCFDSAMDDASTPAVFHRNCDPYDETVTVAQNALGFMFGGYAERSWAGSGMDTTASGDFIFGLAPQAPARFNPTGSDTNYQYTVSDSWPGWGHYGSDLQIGRNEGPPSGLGGFCDQGTTYSGTPDQICGGGVGTWGATQLEVWRHMRPVFPGGQIMTAAMDAQLQAWLVERSLTSDTGWILCYSSANGDPKDSPSEWHSRCDGHARTVVVGYNSLGYTFGGYTPMPWDEGASACCTHATPQCCTGYSSDGSGHFLFRLEGPGLGAAAFGTTGTNDDYQYNRRDRWTHFGSGNGDLDFGASAALGGPNATCSLGVTYEGSGTELCGGSGNWGETQMEMWYAVPPPLPDPNTDAFLQAQPEIGGHTWLPCFDSDTDDASMARNAFHAQCDQYDVTVTIASNSLGYVFGGYVRPALLPRSPVCWP
jgi:hypothetical protein